MHKHVCTYYTVYHFNVILLQSTNIIPSKYFHFTNRKRICTVNVSVQCFSFSLPLPRSPYLSLSLLHILLFNVPNPKVDFTIVDLSISWAYFNFILLTCMPITKITTSLEGVIQTIFFMVSSQSLNVFFLLVHTYV